MMMMMMNGGTRNLFLHCISSHPPAHLVAHQHHIHRYITSNSRKAGTTTISHSNPSSSSSSRVTCNAAVVVGRSSRSDAYIHTSCRPAPLGHFSSQLSRSTSRGTGRRECVFVLFYSPVFFFSLRTVCTERSTAACIDGANYI